MKQTTKQLVSFTDVDPDSIDEVSELLEIAVAMMATLGDDAVRSKTEHLLKTIGESCGVSTWVDAKQWRETHDHLRTLRSESKKLRSEAAGLRLQLGEAIRIFEYAAMPKVCDDHETRTRRFIERARKSIGVSESEKAQGAAAVREPIDDPMRNKEVADDIGYTAADDIAVDAARERSFFGRSSTRGRD